MQPRGQRSLPVVFTLVHEDQVIPLPFLSLNHASHLKETPSAHIACDPPFTTRPFVRRRFPLLRPGLVHSLPASCYCFNAWRCCSVYKLAEPVPKVARAAADAIFMFGVLRPSTLPERDSP